MVTVTSFRKINHFVKDDTSGLKMINIRKVDFLAEPSYNPKASLCAELGNKERRYLNYKISNLTYVSGLIDATHT